MSPSPVTQCHPIPPPRHPVSPRPPSPVTRCHPPISRRDSPRRALSPLLPGVPVGRVPVGGGGVPVGRVPAAPRHGGAPPGAAGAAAVQEPARVPAGAQPGPARPPLRPPGHLPGRLPGAAGAGAGRGAAHALRGAAPAPGRRGSLGQEGAQQGAGGERGGAAGAAAVAAPRAARGAAGPGAAPGLPPGAARRPARRGQGLVGRHEPAGPRPARARRALARQVRRGALGGHPALHGGVAQRRRQPGPGPAPRPGRAHEERGGGAALHHLGRLPVPAAGHGGPALVLRAALPAQRPGAGAGPGGDPLLPLPAQLLHPGQGLLGGGHERVAAHLPAAPARVRPRLPEEAQVPPLLPHAPGHRAGLGDVGDAARPRPPRLRPRRDQLPHLRLHRLGAADRPHRPLLGAALPLPQPGGGPGDEGQRPGRHRQRHHRRPDHPLPPDAGPPRHGQAEPRAAPHHHRPDPSLGAGARPAPLLRGGAVQPVPVAGGLRGAAGPRAGAGRAGLREPRQAAHGGDARGPPRRQALLEAAEAQRLAPAFLLLLLLLLGTPRPLRVWAPPGCPVPACPPIPA